LSASINAIRSTSLRLSSMYRALFRLHRYYHDGNAEPV